MGKQLHGRLFRGTINNINYYVANGVGYVRRKSSLTAKRVLKDDKFEKTRQYSRDLGLASKIASPIYKALPLDIRGRWLFRAIAGEAASMLYKGKTAEEVTQLLWDKYIYKTESVPDDDIQSGRTNRWVSSTQTRKKLWEVFRERWSAQDKPNYIFKQLWDRRGVFKPYLIPQRVGVIPVL